MSRKFPWYDSGWLSRFVSAKEIVRRHYPERLGEFVEAFDILRTPENFREKQIDKPLREDAFQKALDTIRAIPADRLNKDEFLFMGRHKAYELPLFAQIQEAFTDRVSEEVNEQVEPSYHFLSLYSGIGSLSPHLDAPLAKWTLDLCLEQSAPWPIHFSQVVPWPEACPYGIDDWRNEIKNDPALRFYSYSLEPGNAIIFSGSSQWHYREPIPQRHEKNFCHLVFFHFIPKGTKHLVYPARWAAFFGMPELSGIN